MNDLSDDSFSIGNSSTGPWDDEDFVKEMDRRINELESGKVKGYSWEEVKEITRKQLAEIRENKL